MPKRNGDRNKVGGDRKNTDRSQGLQRRGNRATRDRWLNPE